jgi:PRTRC genetic system ThiF family protein
MATTIKKRAVHKKVAEAKPAPIVKKTIHYTEPYLIDPQHPVTINVIGCGGTGSQVLSSLARMNSALIALGHPGLYIRAFDPDRVSEANMGRQLFSASDVEEYKCMVLVGRINRFFGTDWEGIPLSFNMVNNPTPANITISCVDSGAARKGIKEVLMAYAGTRSPKTDQWGYASHLEPYQKAYYWLDFGNMQDRGQVVLGTMRKIEQPKESEYNCLEELPTVDCLHPEILIDSKDDDQGPSCSLAEALQKQDLFINTNLANMGLGILWKLFREARLQYHGCYLNLETMSVNPIKV